MSRSNRKSVRRSIPDVRVAAPRAVEVASEATQRYPNAHELVGASDAWRAWLDEALRRVLGPAAIAGALGVAAAGCALPGVSLDPFGGAATAKMPGDKPSSPLAPPVTFAPLGPPTVPSSPTLAQLVVPSAPELPPAPPLPPRRPPARHPPMMRGGAPGIGIDVPARPLQPVQPPADPPQIEGGLALVRPSS